MTNFFQTPMLPRALNPSPGGEDVIRQMLMQRFQQMFMNPYGMGAPGASMQGNALNPFSGRGMFNPYGGGYYNPGMGGGMGGMGGGQQPWWMQGGGGGFGGGGGQQQPPMPQPQQGQGGPQTVPFRGIPGTQNIINALGPVTQGQLPPGMPRGRPTGYDAAPMAPGGIAPRPGLPGSTPDATNPGRTMAGGVPPPPAPGTVTPRGGTFNATGVPKEPPQTGGVPPPPPPPQSMNTGAGNAGTPSWLQNYRQGVTSSPQFAQMAQNSQNMIQQMAPYNSASGVNTYGMAPGTGFQGQEGMYEMVGPNGMGYEMSTRPGGANNFGVDASGNQRSVPTNQLANNQSWFTGNSSFAPGTQITAPWMQGQGGQLRNPTLGGGGGVSMSPTDQFYGPSNGFWNYDGEKDLTPPPAPPSVMDQLKMFLASILGMPSLTAPAQAERKGADIDEQTKRADEMTGNDRLLTPTPTVSHDAVAYDGLGGPAQSAGASGGARPPLGVPQPSYLDYAKHSPFFAMGRGSQQLGGNDLGNGSNRSYDAEYAGLNLGDRPVRTPNLGRIGTPMVHGPKNPSAGLNRILSGLAGSNRRGQGQAFRTDMGRAQTYDGVEYSGLIDRAYDANPPRMGVNPAPAPQMPGQGGNPQPPFEQQPQPPGGGVPPSGGLPPAGVSGAQGQNPSLFPTGAQTAGAPMYPWLMPYGGQFTAPMSPQEQQALGGMSNFVGGGMGLGGAANYLGNEIGGGYIGEGNPYMQQIQQGMQGQKDIQDQLAQQKIQSAMAAGGNALSGADAAALGQYGALSNANFNQQIGNMKLQNLMNERGLQQGAVPLMQGLSNTQMGGFNQLMNAGGLPRQLQQSDLNSQYQDWLRQVNGMNQQNQYTNQLGTSILNQGNNPGSYQPLFGGSSGFDQLLGGLGGLGALTGLGGGQGGGGLLSQLFSGIGNLFGGGGQQTGGPGQQPIPTGGGNDPNSPDYWNWDSGANANQNFDTNNPNFDWNNYFNQYFAGGGT